MRHAATLVLAMTGSLLAGCAGADGLFDRYTLADGGDQPADSASMRQPGGIEAGRYAGETTLVAQSGACPPDTGVLNVSRGTLRYSDSANGMIDGTIGAGGRIDIRRGSIQLQGRLVANRFAGTVSGGRCAYDLALRQDGVSTPSALGVSYIQAPTGPTRGAVGAQPPGAADIAPIDPNATADADYSRQARFATLLARLRASRAVGHPAPNAAPTPVASETLPAPATSPPTVSPPAASPPVVSPPAAPPADISPAAPPTASASVVTPPPAAVPAPTVTAAAKPATARAFDPEAPIDLAPAGRTTASPAQQAGQLLAQGRIAAARPLYERAAASGDAAAATAVGKTYDPLFLANMHASEVQPDPKLAEAWYRRGAELGDPRASSRLSSLQAMQQQ